MTTIVLARGSASAAPRLDPPSAGHIALALERLGVVGTVLYVAAHPDDENTRLLAWLANERGLRAAYVSLTRGDGGQNLVGPELGPLLGLIRTHELLAARGIDGAEQYFTRAVDFGYSKSAEETLAIWGKDEVLSDLTRVVRVVRPDVIITRFSIDPPNHGHHTASAMLAREAFVAAADPTRFPDQLSEPGTALHQPARAFENKSPWRFKEGEDLSRYLSLDVGGFSPELGRSYTDLAAASRTMHKSQGFGTAPTFGAQLEYFEPTLADKWTVPLPAATKASLSDPLAGIDFSWARYPGTAALQKRLAEAMKAFEPAHPERLLPALTKVHAALTALPDTNPWKVVKLAELDELMLACAGIVLDARAKTPVANPGEPLAISATAIARLASDVKVALSWPDGKLAEPRTLGLNAVTSIDGSFIPTGPFSTPFWLRAHHPTGLFAPTPIAAGIQPVGPPDIAVRFTVQLGAVTIIADRAVRHAWVDPVHGERFRPVEILPAITVTPTSHVRMFPGNAPQSLEVRVRAHGARRSGAVLLKVPTGWKTVPANRAFELEPDSETVVSFEVTPAGTAPVDLAVVGLMAQDVPGLDQAEVTIDHLHVPRTTILSPAHIRAIPLALATGGTRIGYIVGAGDDVPASLSQVGYQVTLLDPKTLGSVDLTPFAAVIAGIRSYNIAPDLKNNHAQLMKYVAGGGTYLVQYLTSTRQRPLGDVPIGPHPFTVDQGRVTDENAAMRPIDPAHPALTTPNKLGPDDYRGWVQERGLYFAATWDPRYQPLLSTNDAGEAALDGAAIVARHGKGAFVYTGIAFFRQLPEGVPGAYRLIANLLALGSAKPAAPARGTSK